MILTANDAVEAIISGLDSACMQRCKLLALLSTSVTNAPIALGASITGNPLATIIVLMVHVFPPVCLRTRCPHVDKYTH